jgi:hypothetical protein
MGNSTTARQLAELGMAGGVLEGGWNSGWDYRTMLTHGLMGAIGGGALVHSPRIGPVTETVAGGMRRFAGKVDQGTAKYVAELLTSNDPTKLAQGIALAAKNQKLLDNLKAFATRMVLGTQTQGADVVASGARKLMGTVPARADENQQQP